MKPDTTWVREALQKRELNLLTRALGELAEKHAYQLKPPYTEIIELRAEQDGQRYAIQFSARLHLHYSSKQERMEGWVFTVRFSGVGFADSPNPPLNELFSAASVDSFVAYAYGKDWVGEVIPTPEQFAKSLEVASQTLTLIPTEAFLEKVGS
jgi:hypothetical protein